MFIDEIIFLFVKNGITFFSNEMSFPEDKPEKFLHLEEFIIFDKKPLDSLIV